MYLHLVPNRLCKEHQRVLGEEARLPSECQPLVVLEAGDRGLAVEDEDEDEAINIMARVQEEMDQVDQVGQVDLLALLELLKSLQHRHSGVLKDPPTQRKHATPFG